MKVSDWDAPGIEAVNTAEGEKIFGKPVRKATERFTPVGADEPLPEIPGQIRVTEADLRKASALWDETVDPKYRGLLDAEVVE